MVPGWIGGGCWLLWGLCIWGITANPDLSSWIPNLEGNQRERPELWWAALQSLGLLQPHRFFSCRLAGPSALTGLSQHRTSFLGLVSPGRKVGVRWGPCLVRMCHLPLWNWGDWRPWLGRSGTAPGICISDWRPSLGPNCILRCIPRFLGIPPGDAAGGVCRWSSGTDSLIASASECSTRGRGEAGPLEYRQP